MGDKGSKARPTGRPFGVSRRTIAGIPAADLVVETLLHSWGESEKPHHPMSRTAATTNDWRQYARCLGADPDLFYPPSEEAAEEAKSICAVCPVREPCLEYAVTAREKDGVWGGLTERERRRLIRQRRKTA
jgi:WhiB family redox-sensing transcriptional regulator